mgnify:FL=1
MVKNLVEKQDVLVEKESDKESDKEPKIYVPVMPMEYLQDTLKKSMFKTFDEIRIYSSYKEQAVSAINLVHKYYENLMDYLRVYYSAYNYTSNGEYSKEFGEENGDAPFDFQKWMLLETDAYGYWQVFNREVEAPTDNNGNSLSLSDVNFKKGIFGMHYSVDPQEVNFAYNTDYVIKVLRKEDVGNTDTEISIGKSSRDLKFLTNNIISFVKGYGG